MPAIITHCLFGTQVYEDLQDIIGRSPVCKQAFLLGNQGPDPLFYASALPNRKALKRPGHMMHGKKPAHLLMAFHDQLLLAQGEDQPAVRAYALGFLCHYLLDSTVHPLVYAQQYAICDAGIEGLSRKDGCSEVHAVIEKEFDEYMLTTCWNLTIADYKPRWALDCPERELAQISAAYARVFKQAYDHKVPASLFVACEHMHRAAQTIVRSPSGLKPKIFGAIEQLKRHYSYVATMSHDNCKRESSVFLNNEHWEYAHPYVEGKTIGASFNELVEVAFARALEEVPRYAQGNFGMEDALQLTGGINFSGRPVEE